MANRAQKRKMAKNKKVKKVEKKTGFLENKLEFSDEMTTFVKTLTIVIVSFLIILSLTLLLSKLGVFDSGYTKPSNETTVISYEEIIIGDLFNRTESEYYVVLDNFEDKTGDIYLLSKLNEYSKSIPLYKIDMKDGMNKNYVSETGNSYANRVEDLKIKTPTLIKISNGNNILYIEGTDNIVNELFK